VDEDITHRTVRPGSRCGRSNLPRALICWGGLEGHTPKRSAHIVRDLLNRHGFKLHVENGTVAFADPAIHTLNLIAPMITLSTIEKAEVDNLCAAVRSRVGPGGMH
jgi:uncharacterized protein